MRKSLTATAIATLLLAPFPALAATPPIESLLVVAQPSAVGSGTSWDTTAPERARLEARIREYYAAVGSRNARTMYEMQTPYIRSRMSFRDYRTDWGYGAAWAARPATKISARLEQLCYCGDWALPNGSKTRRCVLLVDAAEEETDGTVHTGKILEMWEYSGGEWYYGYPGEGDQCPAPGGEPQVEPPRSAASAGHAIATPDQARLKGRVQELQAALNVRNARARMDPARCGARFW